MFGNVKVRQLPHLVTGKKARNGSVEGLILGKNSYLAWTLLSDTVALALALRIASRGQRGQANDVVHRAEGRRSHCAIVMELSSNRVCVIALETFDRLVRRGPVSRCC